MKSDEEVIAAARKFAEILGIPVFLIDPRGDLLFYNKEAGRILGRSFDDSGPMPAAVWGRIFMPTDEDGIPLEPETLPLMVALNEKRPATGTLRIRGIDNETRHIAVAGIPVVGADGKSLGAMAIFWDL